MKTINLFITLVFLLCTVSSCNTNVRKASKLTKDYMLDHTGFLDHYDVDEYILDTVYYPEYSKEMFNLAQEIKEYVREYDTSERLCKKYYEEMEDEKWVNGGEVWYPTEKLKRYKDRKLLMERYDDFINSDLAKVSELLKEKKSLVWKVSPKFLSKKTGNPAEVHECFILDSAMTKVLYHYDENGEEENYRKIVIDNLKKKQ